MSSTGDVRQIMQVSERPLAVGLAGEVGAGAGEGGLTLADFWRIVKQRKLLIVIMFVVFYGLIVAATVVVWRWFPTYPAQALLQLRPPLDDPMKSTDPLVQSDIMERLLTTEAQRIYRWDVLQDVLSLPEIKRTKFYRWYKGADECLAGLQDLLQVGPVRETQLITVSLAIRDASESVLIVGTIVDRYLQKYEQETKDRNRLALEDKKRTQSEVKNEVNENQKELAAFRAQTDVGALESELETLVRSIADQNYVVNSYDQRVADLQAQLATVEGVDPRSLPVTPEDRVIVEADPLLRMYRQQVEALDVEIQALLANAQGPNNKAIKLLRDRRKGYHEREVARREELLDDLRERRVDALRQELARTRSLQARTQDQLEEYQARLNDLDSSKVRYDVLVQQDKRLQEQLLMVDKAVLEAQQIVDVSPKAARLTLEQRPRKAVMPSRPNLILWLGGGLVLALAGSVGLAFLRELTDKAIRTPIDVARHGRLSVLGCVPQLGDEQADLDQIELATRRAPHSLVAEAFRQVRANLVFSGPVESQRVLLITSPGAGNGKTAVAINLAVTFAQGNQRVLLVDCNVRRPAVRQAFAGTRPEGLSNILIGQARLEDVVTPTDIPNLHVLTSGPTPPTPADLLASPHMAKLLSEARARYDRVILDGPPVLLISDSLVLATQVDGVIMVARAVDNSKGALRRAREQLEKVNAHVVGAVLNGVQTRAGGYYRQHYRDFYEYSSEETIPRELPGLPPADSPPQDS